MATSQRPEIPPIAPYYLWLNGAQAGPFDLGDLKSMWFMKEIVEETFYWIEGMEEWQQLGTFVEDRMGCPVPGMKEESELDEDELISLYGANLGNIGQLDARMQQEFEEWKVGQDPAILAAFPAQELIREIEEDDGIDWPQRWRDKGGEFYSGKMIAVKNSSIWKAISDYGAPHPPFSYNSSMGVRDISRREAEGLGLCHQ